MANTTPQGPRSPSSPDETASAKPPSEPKAAFRFERVSAALFATSAKPGAALTVSLRRSYRDAAGAWQHTHSLTKADLLPAILALMKCYEYLTAPDDAEAE